MAGGRCVSVGVGGMRVRVMVVVAVWHSGIVDRKHQLYS